MNTVACSPTSAFSPFSPFSSASAFEQTFADGLTTLLDRHDGLGVYVLVLANAAYEPALWQHLKAPLQAHHARHAETLRLALLAGKRLTEPEDDLLVFLKLQCMGFDAISTTRWREAGPWRIQFNPIRALRPPRFSAASQTAQTAVLQQPFNPDGFHFNKPFLAKEVLWEGELAGKTARLLYNKFPFAPLHGLLVPEPQHGHSQWLTPELHGWAWQCCADLCHAMPGFALAYNSLGAQASVNHLHFQSFLLPETTTNWLPVLSSQFQHNGGAAAYPVACQVAHSAEEAWWQLDALHVAGTPYNLIYTPGRVHILPRRAQGSAATPAWSSGLAWSEMAGIMTVFSQDDLTALSEPDIFSALSAWSVS